jgi:hypothetical protein
MTDQSKRLEAALNAGHAEADLLRPGISPLVIENVIMAAINAYEAWTPAAAKRARPASTKADFEAFWALYPRKSGKLDAERKFAIAARGAAVADILAGLRLYKFSPDPKYIPLPATWLHQGRWTDEPDAPAQPPPKPNAPQGQFSRSAGRATTAKEMADLGL